MPTADRARLIKALEKVRDSTVLVYVTGDRAPAGGQISDDAVRPLHALLRQQGPVKKLDLCKRLSIHVLPA